MPSSSGHRTRCCGRWRKRWGRPSRLAVARWALEAVKEPAARLEALTGSDIPGRTLAAARCWAAGEITMPVAKREILLCHHLAAEMQEPEAVALCHAVGQACSVIHTPRHGMGLPVYELTALVRRYGLPEGAEAVEERVEAYARLLAAQPEEAGPGEKWAAFLLR